jgi:cobyric acid synthase
VFLVLLTTLSIWVFHRSFDTLYERVTISLRKKSSQKQKVKTDIENMQKGENYTQFDPLDIEKKGFVALGKYYE